MRCELWITVDALRYSSGRKSWLTDCRKSTPKATRDAGVARSSPVTPTHSRLIHVVLRPAAIIIGAARFGTLVSMGKVLLLILFAFIVYLIWKSARRGAASRARGKNPGAVAEDMVACTICGVNMPRSEAIESRGRFFCCEEHRALDRG